MVANQEALGPSVGPIPARVFDAHPATLEKDLDGIIGRLLDQSTGFARLHVATKVELLEDCLRGTRNVAAEWVAAACRAKGIPLTSPVAGEEWVAGPALTLRNIRLLIRTLREINQHGAPILKEKHLLDLPHGAVGVRVTPYDAFDAALYGGITAESWLQPGIQRSDVANHQASFYKKRDPMGLVSLVLGAGNVSSIPPMDILYKMFVDGSVVLLKMNPVNEYLGPFLEKALRPLIERGYLAIVYGGAEVGSYLCYHPGIGDVHITGSDKTHDLIVWGPPGPDRDERKRRNDPLLKKPITSELGNVSPVIIVPGPYSEAELTSMAENTAGMITNNASFNCNAAKMLVVPKGWAMRDAFIKKLADVLAAVPPRKAYYPGAAQRYEALTTGHADVRKIGTPGEHALPWTLVLGLDATNGNEPNFTTEPFCSILSEVAIGSDGDPSEFLRMATSFANDRVWGTLNATLFIHPKIEGSAKPALDDALRDLRFGTVAINTWPAMGYALGTTPWGGHPSATLANIQSGLGWVHNTVMLENIEKCVIRAPLKPMPKPIYFPTHKTLDQVGRRLVEFEAAPSWLKVPGIAMTALSG